MARKSTRPEKPATNDNNSGVQGILGGLTSLLGSLAELAEKGKSLQQNGTADLGQDGKLKAVFGFNVRTMGTPDGNTKFTVEPFGNVKKDAAGNSHVDEVREPITDTFEEDDALVVVAEMPGVSQKDLSVHVADDVLTLSAKRGDKKYHKEILLPRTVDPKTMKITANNGVLEIRFAK